MRKLDKRNIEDILSLTPMQEGMLFHYLKAPGSEIYFEQLILNISGKIDKIIFEKAWNFVIETNEMLRAVFRWEKVPKPVQLILKEHPFQPAYYDFSGMDGNEKRSQPEEIEIKDRKETFDLREVPFRVILCKEEEKKYRMIVSHHHILLDGWSCGIILKEFFSVYNRLANGKPLVKPGKTKFKEFIDWYQSQDTGRQKKFWRDYLCGFDSPMELSIKRRKIREFKGTQKHQIRWGKRITGKLKRFVKIRKITLASLLYGAWALLLRQYNHSRAPVFGTTLAGRTAPIPHIEDMAGLFINTLPLRVRPDIQDTLINLVYHLNQEIQNREEYQYTSLVKIKEYSELDPRTRLFDSIVVIENYPLDYGLTQTNGKLIAQMNSVFETTDYDLTVAVFPSHRIKVAFLYKKALFEAGSIVRLADHFSRIVREIIENPEKKVSRLEIISTEEKEQILYEFNDTAADYPKDKTIHELFRQQAGKTPDRTALEGTAASEIKNNETVQLTYSELNQKSDRLALALREKGIKTDTIAAIMVERSLEMIVGLMGILKSGSAYLPIDPGGPEKRIQYMLTDSNANALVITSTLAKEGEKLRSLEVKGCHETIFIDTLDFSNFSSSHLLNFSTSPSSLAYTIYTSGSTGVPKGVMVEHRNVVNLVFGLQQNIYSQYPDNLKVALVAPYVFDASVQQIFAVLLLGRGLILVPEDIRFDGRCLWKFFRKHAVDISDGAPMTLGLMKESGSKGRAGLRPRYFLIGGEALPRALVEGFFKLFNDPASAPKITNVYGPTECCVDSTWYEISKKTVDDVRVSTIPIGKPMPNEQVYVMNREGQLQPVGVPGELYIGGDGVARGYLNQPELTSEKFLSVSNRSYMSYMTYIIYKTGDLARWLADGNIEFLGRMDHQVKVRGFRVELEEIENHLLNHHEIKEAVVTSAGDDISGYLCAYIVSEKELSVGELREYLVLHLPDYMIPSYFVRLERLPLTATGKIDRKALPEPEIKVEDNYIPPENDVEKKLVELWSPVLGIEENIIGIDSNFFELGGHSLRATRLLGLISKVFNVYLSPGTFFNVPTIRGLAVIIKKAEKKVYWAVEAVEKKDYYALSPSQKRLYILQQMDKDNTSYNMPAVMKLEGTLNKDWFESVFLRLIRRHESFRTSFEIVNEEPVQMVHDDVKFEVRYFDLATENTEDTEKKNYKLQIANKKETGAHHSSFIIHHSFSRPFDLSKSPLLRTGLVRLPGGEHLLLFDMHHIISDGTSQGILVNELITLYQGEELAPLFFQYKDYTRWLTGKLKTGILEKQQSYWLGRLGGELPVLTLPTDFSRPDVQSFEGNRKEFLLGKKETAALSAMAGREKVTLFMVLLAVTHVLLWKITGQEDITIGTPIASPRHADLETIIGMFVNTLAMRHFPSGDKSFRGFLREVKRNTLEAFENQEYPFEELVEKLNVPRDTGRNPIFDVMFVFRNWEMPAIKMPGLTLTPYPFENRTSKFDLTLEAIENHGTLSFSLEYCTRLFKESTIERLLGYFPRIVRQVTHYPGIRLSQVEILSREEKQQLLEMATGPIEMIDWQGTIHHWFQQQVEKTPDHIALIGKNPKSEIRNPKHKVPFAQTNAFGERVGARELAPLYITYRELHKKSNQLALVLKEKGIKPDAIVGIMIERSISMVVGIFGILKAGAAYLPIDPDYPPERIDYILKDSEANMLVTTSTLAKEGEKLRSLEVKSCHETIFIDTIDFSDLSSSHLLNFSTSPSSLAYIIYTSGSTGRPKGVIVEQRSIVNILTALQKNYPLKPSDTYLFKTSYIFDVSVAELFGWFPGGGRLAILEKGGEKEPQKIIDLIYRTWITHVNFVPSMFNVFIEELNPGNVYKLSGLKYIFLAGEALLPELVEKIRRLNTHIQLENIYGPTEGTVYSSRYPLSDWNGKGSISIGKPMQNLALYILDKDNHLQPIGVPGELCISGLGVARGYLNQPQLTAEKFLYRSYRSYKSYIPKKIFKTGDLACWLSNGNIEFLGRMDLQVKIRGFRVELGEIENRMLKHSEIKEAVVTSRESNTGGYLCAYIAAERKFPVEELREYLGLHLPDYMIPSFFIELENIPLTPGGKIDRNALPLPTANTGDTYTAPGNELEKKLADLWAEILTIKGGAEPGPIGIDDNFFKLGGNSLKAALLISRMHGALKVKIPQVELFKTPTIKGLTRYIKGMVKERDVFASIEAAETKEYYPLSPAQKRIYISHRTDITGIAYNIPTAVTIEGKLDKNRLANSFEKLIRRHESFRTSFEILNEEPMQKIHDEVGFEIEYYMKEVKVEKEVEPFGQDLNASGEITQAGAAAHHSSFITHHSFFIRPFDLARAPLMRVGLTKSVNNQHILMVDMHHIISDGFSHVTVVKDLMAFYRGKQLPACKLQYRDYSEWLNKPAAGQALEKQEAYWLEEFKGELPLLQLPTDFAGPADQDFTGSSSNFEIPDQETQALEKLALEEQTTLYQLLLAIYFVLISKISGREDIVVGTVTAGRDHPDIEPVVGMFVNTLPLRNYPTGRKTFNTFLKEVKQQTLLALENQSYPFEHLVEKLAVKRDLNYNPLFNVVFVFNNIDQPEPDIEEENLKVRLRRSEEPAAKFHLVLQAQQQDSLYMTWKYRAKLFKPQTIKRFSSYFKELVSRILSDKDIHLKDLFISHSLLKAKTRTPQKDFNF